MPGITILRRDEAAKAVPCETPLSRRARRRNAFEANLALQLERALGGDASLSDIEAMTLSLGAAYDRLTHAIDARTSVGFGTKRYAVLQFGWAQKTGDNRLDALDPYAAKLLSFLSVADMEVIEPRLKAVGVALSKTEISRRHPMDLRFRLSTPWLRFYINLLGGRDKRDNALTVTHERRKPVNEGLGLFVLMTVAVALSILGLGMIASTIWAFSELMMSEMGRDTLAALLDRSWASLATIIAGLSLLRGGG